MIARWCNGSTHGSEPCSPSSNLGRAANPDRDTKEGATQS